MMESDEKRYESLQQQQWERWESLCGRCGACCGLSEGDPCEHLVKDPSGKYLCNIYTHRFGPRKSISGREFMCVPIRNIYHQHWAGDSCCGYKKNLNNHIFSRMGE